LLLFLLFLKATKYFFKPYAKAQKKQKILIFCKLFKKLSFKYNILLLKI
jgi:hypothetical protein